jgi:hypothetical protein
MTELGALSALSFVNVHFLSFTFDSFEISNYWNFLHGYSRTISDAVKNACLHTITFLSLMIIL